MGTLAFDNLDIKQRNKYEKRIYLSTQTKQFVNLRFCAIIALPPIQANSPQALDDRRE